MRLASAFFVIFQLVLPSAFANDPLILQLKPRYKVTKNAKKAGKAKAAKKVAKVKVPKAKYKDVNQIFANVEYRSNVEKKEKNEFLTDLAEAKDLENTERLEDFDLIEKENRREEKNRQAKAKAKSKKRAMIIAKQAPDPQMKEMKVFANSISTVQPTATKANVAEVPQKYAAAPVVPVTFVTEQKSSVPVVETERDSKTSTWSVQPMLGYSLFNIDGQGEDPMRPAAQGYEYFEGYSAGVLADIGTGRWKFETGLVYLKAGTKREVLDRSLLNVNDDYMEYIDRNYIAIPIMGMYYFSDPSQSSIYAKAGIWPAYLTSARLEQWGTVDTRVYDATNEFGRYDILGSLGIGGKMKWGASTHFVVEGYYMRGFKQLYEVNYASGYNQGWLTTFALNFEI